MHDPLLEAMRLALSVEDVRKKALLRLLEHMVWADGLVVDTLSSGQNPTDDAWECYGHILGAEQIWLARILGEPDGPVWPEPDPPILREMARTVHRGYIALLQQLTDADLELSISYENSAGKAFASSVEDILHHVFLHGSYHRGQVALRLRQSGQPPAPTDYIGFVRGAAAATRADAEGR